MANEGTPPNDVVEPVERLLRFGVHSTKAADAAAGVLDAIPDGWAKVDGEWVQIERFGTYLDPKAYGRQYDHHTFTTMDRSPDLCEPVYRLVPSSQPESGSSSEPPIRASDGQEDGGRQVPTSRPFHGDAD